jgi:hypothetical protein
MPKKEIPSIIEEGPLAGASIPLNLWMELNDEELEEVPENTTTE